MILCRNNNRDKRLLLPLIHSLIHTIELTMLHLRRHTNSVVMLLNSFSACLKSIHLALRVCRCRIHVTSPVIQNLWNMLNIFRLLTASKNKVMILRTIKLTSQHTNFINQRLLHNKQMAYVVHATKQINIEIRLKMWIKEFLTIHVHLILVRINHIYSLIFIQSLNTLKKCMNRHNIIMV